MRNVGLETTKPKHFYGYIIVAASVGIQLVVWGIYNSYGVFFNQLLYEFSWTRATISGAHSLSQILIGLGGIMLGSLNDRFGPRILMTASGVLLGLAYLLMASIDSVWQLYIFYGLMVGFGASGTDVVLLSTTARWFVKKRGMMSGIVKIGTGIGIMTMPIAASGLILLYGWRNSYLVIGATLIIFMVLAAQLLRRDPSQMHQLPDGEESTGYDNQALVEVGLSLRQVVRTRHFWLLCITYLAIFFCGMTIIVHITPYAIDLSISAALAATMISAFGGASIIGRFIMGITSDKVGSRQALIICFVVAITGLSWLQFAGGLWPLYLFSIVYGFSHGGFFTLMSPIVAEYFGTRSHGVILGIVYFSGTIGGSLGPLIAGHIFDIMDSYRAVSPLLLALAIIGFILIVSAGATTQTKNETI